MFGSIEIDNRKIFSIFISVWDDEIVGQPKIVVMFIVK